MHYGTFPVLTGTPEGFIRETAGLACIEVIVLHPGDILS